MFLLNFNVFSLSFDYENQSAQEKLNFLWERIENTVYKKLPELKSTGFNTLTNLWSAEYTAQAFSHNGDFMLPTRKKVIHERGVSASFSWVPYEHQPFSGIFSSGAIFGIIRLSLAQAPTQEGFFTAANCIPAIALKILLDNQPSQNIMAMFGLDGHEEANLFEHDFTTVLPAPTFSITSCILSSCFKAGAEVAGQVDANIRAFSCDELASIDTDGTKVSLVEGPYELIFKPTVLATQLFFNKTMRDDFRETLNNRGENIKLYKIFARRTKNDPTLIRIGYIKLTSNFIASQFGDEELFFKHPRLKQNNL